MEGFHGKKRRVHLLSPLALLFLKLMFVEVALRQVESATRLLLSALHLTLLRSELENGRAKAWHLRRGQRRWIT